jgi:CDP-diglyceride synthetase
VADESVSLQFVDLLYAVPVADLAVRVSATHFHHVTASGWTDLAVQMTAITLGWVGHHSNRNRLPAPLLKARNGAKQFLTARFWQFIVEVLIIAAYFALGTRSYLPSGAGIGHPSEEWKAVWLLITFGLYLTWDVLDIYITKRALGRRPSAEDRFELKDWLGLDRRRCAVTSAFLALMFVVLWLEWARNFHPSLPHASAVVFDLVAIVILYLYRVVHELALSGDLERVAKRAQSRLRLLGPRRAEG